MFKIIPAALAALILLVPVAALADDTAPAANAPAKTEPASPAKTEPKIVSPELMRQNAQITVLQTHMNAFLTQRDNLNAQIEKLQKNIDAATTVRDSLSK
jgi:hypothetical protein